MWNICIISKIYVVKYVYVFCKKIYVVEAENMWFPHKYVASGNPGAPWTVVPQQFSDCAPGRQKRYGVSKSEVEHHYLNRTVTNVLATQLTILLHILLCNKYPLKLQFT